MSRLQAPAAFLGLAVWAVLPARVAGFDAETDRKIVDYVLKTPTPELDAKLANRFLDLDAAAMPKKKRESVRAKQLELNVLLKIAQGKKKGGIRWPASNECARKVYAPADISALLMAGFVEVEEDAVDYIERKTNCTEADLACEFTLSIVVEPRKKGPPLKRYFLHERDPLEALVGEHRGGVGGQTRFFGTVFSCNR